MSFGYGATNVPKPPQPKKYTKTELRKMNKEEQAEILHSLGVTKIPKDEDDRINKILELV